MSAFVPGQRWISDTELELGLGTILTLEHRIITVLFSATGETRQYASHNCPLTRVQFTPGDRIKSHEGWLLQVTDVIEQDGLISYRGLRTDSGAEALLPESQLDNNISFSKPQERLLAGQIDKNCHFSLRYRTFVQQNKILKSPLRGLCGARTSLIPHQLHIAEEVGKRYAPRVLLADEVGLGKTIEAGLIMHQQLLTGRAQRVLVVVPESLQHQWLVEMLRRFNLHFSLFDAERCRLESDDNPFEAAQLVLVSLEFLRNYPQHQAQVLGAQWDLLVVDEAHHLEWSEAVPSTEYRLIEALSIQTPGVLLLTATPEQLGVASHFARLRLLDPDRFHDLEAFMAEEARYQPVAEAVQELLDHDQLSDASLQRLHAFLGDAGQKLLDTLASGCEGNTRKQARDNLINMLLDRHGTGRVLFRNTRAGVPGFPGRLAEGYPQPLPELYRIALEDGAERTAQLAPERAYLRAMAEVDCDPWWKFDPRVDWLINLLRLLKQEKVLLICANASTVLDLDEALRVRSGLPAAVFHEGMSIIERDRAAAYFADNEYGAQVLLCSEIGSEGRNFQFAHHLVLFDLPENPDLLEQRIGRLDRIGQTQTVQIHVPYLEDCAQETLYRWYEQGLNAFAQTCATGNNLLQQHGEALQSLLAPAPDAALLDSLIETTRSDHAALVEQLHNGRDRLLELHSRGRGDSGRLINRIEAQDQPKLLRGYLELFCEHLGIETEEHSKHCLILRPGEHMVLPSLPGLPSDGTTITFDRATALGREDIQFMTWEHPLIRTGMELLMTSELGNSSVALINNKALKPGTMLVEAIYVLETQAAPALQLDRFLPMTPIRTLIDPSGNDLAERVKFDTLDPQLEKIKRSTAAKLVKNQRSQIQQALEQAQQSAEIQVPTLLQQATQQMLQTITTEIRRLASLRSVNPNIRDEEIAILKQQATDGHQALQNAGLRLDCLRVMFAA